MTYMVQKWATVKNLVVQDIATEKYKVGDRFMTLEELGSKYNVSRSTARKVFAALVEDGLIETRYNKGTFVRKCNPSIFADIEAKLEEHFDTLVEECFHVGKTEYDISRMLNAAIEKYHENNMDTE